MNVSVRELYVLSKRVLQRLSCPSGSIAGASRLVVEAEIHDRAGLGILDELVSKGERVAAGDLEIVTNSPVFGIVEADETSALIGAPLMLDLACAKARARGWGWVVCRNMVHLGAAANLDEIGEKRGCVTRVSAGARGEFSQLLSVEMAGQADLDGDGDGQWFTSLGVPEKLRERVADLADSATLLPEGGDLEDLLRHLCPEVDPEESNARHALRRVLLDGSRHDRQVWPGVERAGDLHVACLGGPVAPDGEEGWVRARGYEWIVRGARGDSNARIDESSALLQGLEVDETVWNRLWEVASATLVPPSEQSRQDAGPESGSADR